MLHRSLAVLSCAAALGFSQTPAEPADGLKVDTPATGEYTVTPGTKVPLSLINSISTNRVEGRTYFGLAMSYEIPVGSGGDSSVELFGAIENLFDTDPAIAPGGGGGGGSNYPTNPVYFDTFGSRFRAGVRFNY